MKSESNIIYSEDDCKYSEDMVKEIKQREVLITSLCENCIWSWHRWK